MPCLGLVGGDGIEGIPHILEIREDGETRLDGILTGVEGQSLVRLASQWRRGAVADKAPAVLLRCDSRVRFSDLAWEFASLTNPDVGVYLVAFQVRESNGGFGAFVWSLPRDRGQRDVPAPRLSGVAVLKGSGEEALAALRVIQGMRENASRRDGVLRVMIAPEVRVEEVMHFAYEAWAAGVRYLDAAPLRSELQVEGWAVRWADDSTKLAEQIPPQSRDGRVGFAEAYRLSPILEYWFNNTILKDTVVVPLGTSR